MSKLSGMSFAKIAKLYEAGEVGLKDICDHYGIEKYQSFYSNLRRRKGKVRETLVFMGVKPLLQKDVIWWKGIGGTRHGWANKLGLTVDAFNKKYRIYGQDERSFKFSQGRNEGNTEWKSLGDKKRDHNIEKIVLGHWEEKMLRRRKAA